VAVDRMVISSARSKKTTRIAISEMRLC
jgi:hypothetical protein